MKRECKSHHLICTYINIPPLWYCSAKSLHSNCTPDEITIEFALIWSVAEVNQVVLSLASILMAIYIYMYAIVHMHMCVLIEAII